jgi:hypothetical protein
MMVHRCLLTGMLALVLTPLALGEIRHAEGVVDQVQLLDASAVADESFLILSLVDEHHFLLPEATQLPASPGVLVAVDYLPPEAEGDLPQACRVRVLGMPISIDGEEVLQRASRPFEVYRNSRAECQQDSQ